MIPLCVIRPQPGCASTVSAARAMGLAAHGFPMFEVRPVVWDAPDPETVQAMLFGSANAIRHGGSGLTAFRGKPAYVVGDRTGDIARDAGFEIAGVGEGGLQSALDALEGKHLRLLRLAGAAHIPLQPPEGVTIVERIVYESEPLPMPEALASQLRGATVTLIHSAEAARHFASECADRGIDRRGIALAVIGPRVAEAAGDGWKDIRYPVQPTDGALLALAREMCQTVDERKASENGSMNEPTESRELLASRPPRRNGQLMVGLLAFVLGAALVGWMAWRGYLGDTVSAIRDASTPQQSVQAAPSAAMDGSDEETALVGEARAVGAVEARVAMLEDRISRLNLQANAASGNAARAEGLLIAFAARRMVDRGEPLRYLADQLRLRFSNAQPRAVEAVIAFSDQPVTLDQLSARLEALSPELIGSSPDETFWDKASREISSLFTVRREASAVMGSEAGVDRARMMLTARRVPEAIDQVKRLPGAAAAERWIEDAQRYAAAQRALDLIETTAMLEPSRLQDSEGNRVEQASPIVTPTTAASASPVAPQPPAR